MRLYCCIENHIMEHWYQYNVSNGSYLDGISSSKLGSLSWLADCAMILLLLGGSGTIQTRVPHEVTAFCWFEWSVMDCYGLWHAWHAMEKIRVC